MLPYIIAGIITVLIITLAALGYVKAPPDTAYIISGFRKPRILIGKAGIRIPFLERLDKLSLKMFSVDVKTTDYVPNAEYINVKVDATVKIRIGQSEEMMTLASKFFLNESETSIIRNDVDKQVNIIISNAQAEAAKLVAEGEAEYMRMLAEAYDTADKKDFYEFTIALDALKQSLTGDEKTIILDADSALAQILTGN